MKAGMRTNFADVCKQQPTLASSARPCSMSNSSTRLFFAFFFLPWPPSPGSHAVDTAFDEDPRDEDPRYLPALHAQGISICTQGLSFPRRTASSSTVYSIHTTWVESGGRSYCCRQTITCMFCVSILVALFCTALRYTLNIRRPQEGVTDA